ncbi:MAG: hypothetical protein ACFB10_01350 [Salibacteraceae bacterium]
MIRSVEHCDSCHEIVLIADNNAMVRDMRLLHQLKVVVHIIACGAFQGRVRHQYIQIAMATGGSIHTMEGAFDFLTDRMGGERISIGSQHFMVVRGKLQLVH